MRLFCFFLFLTSVNAVNGPTYGYRYKGSASYNFVTTFPSPTATNCNATKWRDSAYGCQRNCFDLTTCCTYTFEYNDKRFCSLDRVIPLPILYSQVPGTNSWSGTGPACGGIAPILWLRVDSLSSLEDRAKVSSWPDSSMRATPATQSSPSKQPTYMKYGWDDGTPAVYFDGIDDVMRGSMSFPNQSTVIAVFKDTGTTIGCCSGLFITLPGMNGIGLVLNGTNGLQVIADWSDSWPDRGAGEVSNVVSTIVVTYEATTTTLHVNGILLASHTGHGNSSTSFAIGSRDETLNRYTKGLYKEVIVYGSALSDADRNSVLDEIMSRVTIPTRIYVNHENAIYNVVVPATDALFSSFTVVIVGKLYGDELRLQPTAGFTINYTSSNGILRVSTPTSQNATTITSLLNSVRFFTTSYNTTARVISYSFNTSDSVFYHGNGHSYGAGIIPGAGITWNDARDACAARTVQGKKGYLVTLTTSAEQSFFSQIMSGAGWIGASDDVGSGASEGVWKWVTGPEAGTTFYNGTCVAGMWCNWVATEPSNTGNGEHWANSNPNFQWNDLPQSWSMIKGYFCEYGGLASDVPAPYNATGSVTVAYAITKIRLNKDIYMFRDITTPRTTDVFTGFTATIQMGKLTGDELRLRSTVGYDITYNFSAGVLTVDSTSGTKDTVTLTNLVKRASFFTTQNSRTERTISYSYTMSGGAQTNNYNTDTGHSYEMVSAVGVYWEDARDGCAARTLQGRKGYLVTLTTSAEQSFFDKIAMAGQGGWIGASDVTSEGVWKWMTGPEAGTTFWNGAAGGTCVAGMWCNWVTWEPNNGSPTGENWAESRRDGQWNDFPSSYPKEGYFCEYGGLISDVPYTSTGSLKMEYKLWTISQSDTHALTPTPSINTHELSSTLTRHSPTRSPTISPSDTHGYALTPTLTDSPSISLTPEMRTVSRTLSHHTPTEAVLSSTKSILTPSKTFSGHTPTQAVLSFTKSILSPSKTWSRHTPTQAVLSFTKSILSLTKSHTLSPPKSITPTHSAEASPTATRHTLTDAVPSLTLSVRTPSNPHVSLTATMGTNQPSASLDTLSFGIHTASHTFGTQSRSLSRGRSETAMVLSVTDSLVRPTTRDDMMPSKETSRSRSDSQTHDRRVDTVTRPITNDLGETPTSSATHKKPTRTLTLKSRSPRTSTLTDTSAVTRGSSTPSVSVTNLDNNKGLSETPSLTHHTNTGDTDQTATYEAPQERKRILDDEATTMFRVSCYTGIASGVVGTSAMHVSKVFASVQALHVLECNFTDAFDGSDGFENPTGVRIGPGVISRYAGAAVMAVIIPIGIMILYKIIDLVSFFWWGTCETFPGKTTVLVNFFFQPLVFCSARCAYYGSSVSFFVCVGGTGIVLCIAIILEVFRWRVKATEDRWASLYGNYDPPMAFFASFEFLWMFLFGMICSFTSSDPNQCRFQTAGILIMYSCHAGILLIVRPYKRTSELVAALVMDCGHLAGISLIIEEVNAAGLLVMLISSFSAIAINIMAAIPRVVLQIRSIPMIVLSYAILPTIDRKLKARDEHIDAMHEMMLQNAHPDEIIEAEPSPEELFVEMMSLYNSPQHLPVLPASQGLIASAGSELLTVVHTPVASMSGPLGSSATVLDAYDGVRERGRSRCGEEGERLSLIFEEKTTPPPNVVRATTAFCPGCFKAMTRCTCDELEMRKQPPQHQPVAAQQIRCPGCKKFVQLCTCDEAEIREMIALAKEPPLPCKSTITKRLFTREDLEKL